jgi:Protein of unknown function DUF262/Protein of unknown function (DUF1524)
MPMRGRLEYEMSGIASVLKGRTFQVPIYQRSYAWDKAEVSDFWDDLKHAIDSGEPDYFLGTLVLTPDKTTGRTTIIDGQQRLATTSILLAVLRDVYRERGEDELADEIQKDYLSWFDRRSKEREPRLVLNEEDDPFFRDLIVEDGKPPKPTRDSHERLEAAYANLKDCLRLDVGEHGKRGDDRLLMWADYLDEQASVITVTVPTEADAFVIFETLNDRGAPLTLGDLLKNYLFMKSGSRLETVKTNWVQALASMDLSAENELFITFLRHHWSSTEGAIRERELYSRIKDAISSAAQAVKYTSELTEAAKLYRAITEPGDDHWGEKGFGASARTNVRTLLDLGLEQNRPLLLAVMQHFTVKEQQKTLKALVAWSVRGLVVGGIGGGQTERAYCDAAVRVRKGTIKDTKALLKELTAIVPDNREFEDEFARARQTKPKIARYIQLALERAKRGDAEPELVPNEDAEQVNLEHILPRNPTTTEWPQFAPEDVSHWANRLGNHTLLKKSENANIGNKRWSVKQQILAKSSLTLTKEAGAAQSWDKNAIIARQKRLAKLALKTWPR